MTALAPLVKTVFRGYGISLPTQASGRPRSRFPGDEDGDGLDPEWLFEPASMLGYHLRTVSFVSALYHAFINEMATTICRGWNAWQQNAHVDQVPVNGGMGCLPPGGLLSVDTMNAEAILGRMSLADEQPMFRRYAESIAHALSAAWAAWAGGYTCPVPFPAASALPGPLAACPSTPLSLAAGSSAGDCLMTAEALASAMKTGFGACGQHSSPLFDAFGEALSQSFQAWLTQTQLIGLLAGGGTGFPVAGALGMGGRLAGPGVAAQPADMTAVSSDSPPRCDAPPPEDPLSGIRYTSDWIYETDFLRFDLTRQKASGPIFPGGGGTLDAAVAELRAVRPAQSFSGGLVLHDTIGALQVRNVEASLGRSISLEATGAEPGIGAYLGRDPFNPLLEVWGKGSFLTAEGGLEGFIGSDGERKGIVLAQGATAAVVAGDLGFEINVPVPFTRGKTLSLRSSVQPGRSGGGNYSEVHGYKDLDQDRLHLGGTAGTLSVDVSLGAPFKSGMDR